MTRSRHAYCRYCERCKYCHSKRNHRSRKRRVVSKQGLCQRRKRQTHQQVLELRKKVLTLNASTQLDSPQTLSPLCLGGGRRTRNLQDYQEHCQVTPQMIYRCLQELSKWRETVELKSILSYMLNHFPVNKNKKQTEKELHQKLEIAQAAGMVYSDAFGRWGLRSSLEKLRQIPQTQLTLFWKLYCNTITPIKIQSRKAKPVNKPKSDSDSDSLPSLDESRCNLAL